MEFFSQTYIALRGPTGAPQSAVDIIAKLSDRLSPSTLLADRRAAVLALKGLTRDCKADVGDRALPGLIQVLQDDAEVDPDIGKAVLETLHHLCEVDETAKDKEKDREISFKHTDYFLKDEQATHTLFKLLLNSQFYIRYSTLQLLSTLLQNKRTVVQNHFLKASNAASSIIAVVDDRREIIRNESIATIHSLMSQSPDIQKVLAFEGAFEKLFEIVTREGGIEGDVIVHDVLRCVDGLLRFNSSNQAGSYFRGTSLPALLFSFLLFPFKLQQQDAPPQEFALQFWDSKKAHNASLVVGTMGMLIGSKGTTSQETHVFIRCLVELALASNAPTSLKTQALQLLPSNLAFPLADVIVTPYMPVPESNGEEWDRLEPASALDALVELGLHGEYNGLYGDKRLKDSLDLRAAALGVFGNFVCKDEIKQAIVQGMLSPQESTDAPAVSPLLHALCLPPASPLNIANVMTTHFATLLFSFLLSSSSRSKSLARSIKPPFSGPSAEQSQGQFFVPADAVPDPVNVTEPEDEDAPQSLLQLLSENLSLCFLTRSRVDSANEREVREWDRLIVCYLCLLVQWLWEDAKSVKEFLDAGGLGVLVEPINQTAETESLVPGLCAFLLGVCYEFNREPGEITRSTIHAIISRLTVDALVGHMTRVREDDRFKSVGPECMVLLCPTSPGALASNRRAQEQEGEIWFDWAFVDFWKSNQYAVQRALGTDPSSLATSSGPSAESMMLIDSLRDVIRAQAEEIDALNSKLKDLSAGVTEANELKSQVGELEAAVQVAEARRKSVEKEQEDLLVLLDEMNTKRRRDKERMKDAGLEVSEDEDEAGEDEEDGDEE
ncbi:p115 like vesicle tethering protein [Pisolithus orientalis]|uniref:p115 like vesicle tethering protein n=1 Tax=Pisolithus orientalis TaxID=936130 RepID=UPI0022240813|nr:p115 like vesicle tethering protein [Pisolithus orientalis]KAI5995340.1 p115 like vesicle tethering protein [Pisolithus orientalis]